MAGHKNAVWVLALVSFTESSFFLIPPDIILIPMCISRPNRSILYALVCSISSVLGGLFGYWIGYLLFETIGIYIVNFYNAQEAFETFKQWYELYGLWAVIIAGFTPIPYKIATIVSGAVSMNILAFTLASFGARALRFFTIAIILKFFGATVQELIEKYFGILSILFIIVLIAGFLVIL